MNNNKIFILMFFFILACSCTENAKPDTDNLSATKKIKEQRLYFGDSLITLSFLYQSDTTFKTELEKGEFTELITFSNSGDTTTVNVRKDLVAGIYNGACEIKNDTLNLNYWLDSSDCISAMVHSRMIYKVKAKNTGIGKVKTNFIRRKSPLLKHCE